MAIAAYELAADYSVPAVPPELSNDFPPIVESAPDPLPQSTPPLGQEQSQVSETVETSYQAQLVKRHLIQAYESNLSEATLAEPSSRRAPMAVPLATENDWLPGTEPLETNVSYSEAAASEAPPSEEDFSQLGSAFTTRRAPQTFWSEEAVNTISGEGLRQGGLSSDQSEQNALLANEILKANPGSRPALSISAGDLALILQQSGISFSRQDPNQLRAAANYLNSANDDGEQRELLRKALDVFHTLDKQGVPQLSRDQMMGQLWVAARVPAHAIEKMSNAELTRTYQDVAAVVNGPAGQHRLKVGKHEVTLTINDSNDVVSSKTKKPSVWGKIGKIALTVASFVPGPVGIAARIASSVVSAAEGIKNKNWLQAVVGGASGVAAGASAIAGRAISGAAATTARVADGIARGARAWQTGLQAVRAENPAGLFRSLAGIGSAVAGAVGDSAETVAGWARNVETWAGRAYVAAEVRNISRMGWQDQLLAIGGHGANLILDSGDLRPATSAFEVKWKLGVNLGQTFRAGLRLQEAVRSGDVLLMSEAAAGLRATSHNAYQNAAAAPTLLRAFEAQQRVAHANSTGATNRSDLQYDGAWIGANGAAFMPAGPFTIPLIPALPNSSLDSPVPTIYVNGVLNTVDVQSRFMSRLATATGSAVYGIHNASQGIVGDLWQSVKDKLDLGVNPPVDTLARHVHEQLTTGNGLPINLVGHSQGALIISRALDDVKKRLLIEDGLTRQQVESLFNRVTVTTFGGASSHYPNGPQYFHYINRGDFVAMPAGLGGDLIPSIPLLHGGRGATIIRFTDISLPNPHDSNIYLNIYRRPDSFANGNNPYTPQEIKLFNIRR